MLSIAKAPVLVTQGAASNLQRVVQPATPAPVAPSKAVLDVERLATLGTLAGGIGHELANAVAVLVSAADGISQAFAGKELPDAEDVAHLKLAVEHVRAHANSLKQLGKPARDNDVSQDVCAIVTNAVAMLERTGRGRGAQIVVNVCEPTPVRVTRTRIEQVLLNLIGNACDAVLTNARTRAKARVEIDVRRVGVDHVKVSVRDNGPGMPKHVLDRIFEPYFTTKPAGHGTGLGLPVCRQIIEQYASELRVATTEGVGTDMSFELLITD